MRACEVKNSLLLFVFLGGIGMNEKNEIVLFENQSVKLEVNMKDETVWLTQQQMSELFEKDN